MQRIFAHLTYLLTEHDCVVIPNFGGFVVHREGAQYLMKEDIFAPPAYTIGFNEQLHHSDGLLINSLMRVEDMDYKTAQKELELFVDDIKNRLDTDNSIVFPEIGEIKVSTDGNYQFLPARETPVNASMYGFTDFYLPLLTEIQQPVVEQELVATDERKDRSVILIPISKRLIQSIASAAAIVIAVLMISTPIDNVHVPTQYASIIHTDIIQPLPAEKQAVSQPAVSVQVENKEAEVKEVAPVAPPTVVQTSAPEIPVVQTPTKSARLYYIIVAGTPVQSKADKLRETIQSELSLRAAIVEKDNMSRVYVAEFSDKQEAESYLEDFRLNNPKYKDAWLLSVRQ